MSEFWIAVVWELPRDILPFVTGAVFMWLYFKYGHVRRS